MGHQVIKQPDGQLAIFHTGTDTFAMVDATPEEVESYFVELAADDARREAQRIIKAVMKDKPRKVYARFAKTWEEAATTHLERGGDPTLLVPEAQSSTG